MDLGTNVKGAAPVTAMKNSKFGLKDKVGYMFGEFGNDFNFIFVVAFLMVFYTNVLGINPAYAGIILMVARIWDAFADVAVGRFIDSRKTTKNGKFKPWIIRFAPFLSIMLVLTFVKVPGLSSNGAFIYAFVTYILWGTLYSAVNIPYGSMASVITNDSVERASLSNFRSIGGALASAVVATVVPMVVFVNNKPNSGRFLIIAIIFAVISLVWYSLCYKLATERVTTVQNTNPVKPKMSITVKGILKNKPFLMLVLATLIILLSTVITGTFSNYLYMVYFHNTKALSISGMLNLLNIVIIAPCVGPLIKKFGKKEAVAVGLLISAIMSFMLFLLPIHNAILFVVLSYIANLGYNFFNFTLWAFVTDVIDYQEYLTGIREDGTVYSVFSFTRKIAQAVAGGVGGFALAAIGYVANAPQQSTEVAMNIKRIFTLTPAVIFLIVFFIFMFLYPLTKGKLTELTGELETRRAKQ